MYMLVSYFCVFLLHHHHHHHLLLLLHHHYFCYFLLLIILLLIFLLLLLRLLRLPERCEKSTNLMAFINNCANEHHKGSTKFEQRPARLQQYNTTPNKKKYTKPSILLGKQGQSCQKLVFAFVGLIYHFQDH